MKDQDSSLARWAVCHGSSLRLALVPGLLALCVISAQGEMTGLVRAYTQETYPGSQRSVQNVPGTAIADSLTYNSTHATANANYSVDLATGIMQAYAAISHDDNSPHGMALAEAQAGLGESLYFLVPAGTYPEALNVTITGSIHGSLGRSAANTYHGASLWSQLLATGPHVGGDLNGVGLGPGQTTLEVNEPFSITFPLVAAGTTLAVPTTVTHAIDMDVGVYAEGNYGVPAQNGSAVADMGHSVRFLSMQLPPGVTYTSSSGVFMTAVPEPVKLVNVARSSGVFRFTFLSRASRPYTVQYQDALAEGEWNTLTNLTGTGHLLTMEDALPSSVSRFYRVRSD